MLMTFSDLLLEILPTTYNSLCFISIIDETVDSQFCFSAVRCMISVVLWNNGMKYHIETEHLLFTTKFAEQLL